MPPYISQYLEHGDFDFLLSLNLTNAISIDLSRSVVKNSLSFTIKKDTGRFSIIIGQPNTAELVTQVAPNLDTYHFNII